MDGAAVMGRKVGTWKDRAPRRDITWKGMDRFRQMKEGATDKQAIDNQATFKPRSDSDKGKTSSLRMTQYLPGPQPNPVVTEPRSVRSVKGLKTLSNKARSSSQSRLARPKFQEQRGRLETSIDQALFESKLKSRSKSQPVLSSSRSLSSLVPYPSQVLPKDVIHPVNQLSSTGFAPLARSAYNPYKSQSSLVCEKLPSLEAKPDVAPTKLGRSCSEKRMKDLELTKSPTLSGSRRRNVSEMTTPDETPFGMVVDASSDCSSINEISEHFSSVIWKDPNSAGLGKLSDCELFDPQSDSGIDLPGKHIADVTLVAPIALNRKRPDILWAAEPQASVTEVISSPVSVMTNDSTEINLNSDLNRVRMFQSDVGHKYCGRLRDGGNELLAKGLSRELPGRVLCKSIDNGLDGGVGSRNSRDVCLIPSFCEPTNFGDDFDLYENCHRSMVSSSLSQLNPPHVVSVSSSIIANSPSPIYSFSPSVESCSHVDNDVETTKSRHNKQSLLSCSPNYFSSSAAQKFNNIPSSNYHVLLSSHNQRGNGPYDDSKGHRQHRDQLPSNSFTLNRDSNSNSNSDGSYNQFPSPSVESSFYTDPQLLRPSPFNNPDQQPKLPDPYSRGHNSKAKGGPRQSYVKSNSLPRNRLDSVRNQQSSSSVPNRNGVGSKNPHLSPGANLEFKNPHHSMSAFTKCDVSPFELLKLSSSNQPGSISDHYASPQLVVHTDPKFPSPSTAGSNSPHRIVPPTEHEFGLMDPESKLKLIQNLTEGDYASRPDDYVGSFSSLRKSDISKISPSTDAVAKSAPPRQMRYNESFKHASNNAFFGSDDLKPSPRSNQFEHLSHHRNDRSGDALISPGGRMDSQRPSESHYTYDLPGGSDFNRNNKQNGHLTTEPYQGKRESGFTTTHGFPLLSGRQKSTPDISQHLDNDYVPNYDNTHLVAKQRGFKMSADNLIDEDSVVARDASRSQQNAGLDFAPRPSPKPKLLPLQKHHAPQSNKLTEMVLEKSCGRCLEKLQPGQDLITSSGEIFHKECFVCAACFRPFPDGVYYDFDNRKYCEEDFNLLFAPNCQACGDFVKGRVIKAMGGKSWHAECFVCSRCETPLADTGFHTVKSEPDKPYCKPCSEYMMKLESGKRFCGKCHAQIENDGLRIKDEWFHAYHFNCTKCNAELTPTARESEGKLYCLKCSDSRTCALCRRTIEKFERSLVALNKSWHPDCFRCSFCDKPFNGDKHFVYNAQPYCEEHYNQLFGNLCFYCNRIVPSPGVSIEQKIRKYCEHHFECFFCGKSLTPNTDVVMLDSRPVCMKCTQRFPGDFKNQCFKNRGVSIGASLNPKAKLLNPFKKK
ncbi:uncharacterized protein LOC142358563 isoform X1 [Convolutriloba macropyga]|uniref:uncharacterized protein LOC142358563 isoform X1 n=1 Tax=Convolutriloba macropyga TaxID=536237 RepID=UPI003F523E9D